MLLVSGPNVMKGYVEGPEVTSRVLKDGWYVTGDLARVDGDGFPTLARGQRLPLAEPIPAITTPGENRAC